MLLEKGVRVYTSVGPASNWTEIVCQMPTARRNKRAQFTNQWRIETNESSVRRAARERLSETFTGFDVVLLAFRPTQTHTYIHSGVTERHQRRRNSSKYINESLNFITQLTDSHHSYFVLKTFLHGPWLVWQLTFNFRLGKWQVPTLRSLFLFNSYVIYAHFIVKKTCWSHLQSLKPNLYSTNNSKRTKENGEVRLS